MSAGSTSAKLVCTEPGGDANVTPPPGLLAPLNASPLKRSAPAAHSWFAAPFALKALVSRYSSVGRVHARVVLQLRQLPLALLGARLLVVARVLRPGPRVRPRAVAARVEISQWDNVASMAWGY